MAKWRIALLIADKHEVEYDIEADDEDEADEKAFERAEAEFGRDVDIEITDHVINPAWTTIQ